MKLSFTVTSLVSFLQEKYETERDTWALFANRLIRWEECSKNFLSPDWVAVFTMNYEIDEYCVSYTINPRKCFILVSTKNLAKILWIDINIEDDECRFYVSGYDINEVNKAAGYLSLMLA